MARTFEEEGMLAAWFISKSQQPCVLGPCVAVGWLEEKAGAARIRYKDFIVYKIYI